MNASTQEQRDYGFVIGLLTGTCVGAGLTMWLAPRSASELRRRGIDRAADLSRLASEAYQQAETGVGEAVGELTRRGRGVRGGVGEAVADVTRKGLGVRDVVAEAVARGAHEVERYATAVQSDRIVGAATVGG